MHCKKYHKSQPFDFMIISNKNKYKIINRGINLQVSQKMNITSREINS